MASSAQAKSFIDIVAPIAAKICKERGYGNAQAWTCVAQACCESAFGTSKIMANANAFFGIKANKSWVQKAKYGGKVYNAKTKECYDGKTYVSITDCFRAYNSMEDSIRDYFDLIEGQRYKASLDKRTVLECITEIKKGGYATSPTYISTITSIFEKYKSQITRYTVDGSVTPKPAAKKGNVEIAEEVWQGKWGNGQDRKDRLRAAGYDPIVIQRLVNAMK